jgi:hypothetical protein
MRQVRPRAPLKLLAIYGLIVLISAGFGLALTTAIFAQLIHYGVPGIISPVKDKSKVKSNVPLPHRLFSHVLPC